MIKILRSGKADAKEIFSRTAPHDDVRAIVAGIIADVRKNGDAALKKYCERFDGATLTDLRVSEEEIEQAFSNADPDLIRVIRRAAENITLFHKRQLRDGFSFVNPDGATVGQKITAIQRAGVYVPGGTAAYPSTVLMDVIPAKIAGVNKIVMTTPSRGGEVAPVILAAAKIAGVDEIYKIGGAQAIAALAYGTETVPRVDKIVGPGNAFVAEAKKQVYGHVAIDAIAGPSEILIISDAKSDPAFIAADLLSQAEHDKLASAVLITDDDAFARAVQSEIERQITQLPRREIIRASIDNYGKIIVTDDLADAVRISDEIAPEHLELSVEDPFTVFQSIRNAGSVFLGRYTPEALGDYMAGPNHTLPTGGTARFSSPLSVDDFVKKIQYVCYPDSAETAVAGDVALFARSEGLTAHARSAEIRREYNE